MTSPLTSSCPTKSCFLSAVSTSNSSFVFLGVAPVENEEDGVDVDASAGRFVRYQFTPAFLKLCTVGATWVNAARRIKSPPAAPSVLFRLACFHQGGVHGGHPTHKQLPHDRAALLPGTPAQELWLWLWFLHSQQSQHLWTHLRVPSASWRPQWVKMVPSFAPFPLVGELVLGLHSHKSRKSGSF